MLQCNVRQTQTIVVSQRNIQIVNKHHVRVLQTQTRRHRLTNRQTHRLTEIICYDKYSNNNTTTIFMVLSSWRSAIPRVHPVHMMNADSAPGGRQPSDQVNRLGLWVRRLLSAHVVTRKSQKYTRSARSIQSLTQCWEPLPSSLHLRRCHNQSCFFHITDYSIPWNKTNFSHWAFATAGPSGTLWLWAKRHLLTVSHHSVSTLAFSTWDWRAFSLLFSLFSHFVCNA